MSTLNTFLPRVINCVNQSDKDKVVAELQKREYRVIELHGESIRDKRSFFLRAAKDLPQPNDRVATDNWDALIDNLWQELSEITASKVAIIWSDVHMMLDGGLSDLLTAMSCFEQLAQSVATSDHGFSHAVSMQIFLVGEGVNFPPSSDNT